MCIQTVVVSSLAKTRSSRQGSMSWTIHVTLIWREPIAASSEGGRSFWPWFGWPSRVMSVE